jgi:ribosomal protein S18 acetylase RimI-like enzyme
VGIEESEVLAARLSRMSTITVRDADADDIGRLLELFQELAEGDPARMPADPATARAALSRILTDSDHHLCVASVNGTVVGAAELIVVPNRTHHGRSWAVIENVIVIGSARGNGIGTRLLKHLLAIAQARDCYKVQLHSGKQRTNAHRLYQRLGFRPVAEGFKLYYDGTRTSVGG